MYLTTESSYAYYYVKDTYYEGSLTSLKVKTEIQSETFI